MDIIYIYARAENSVCKIYQICIKHLENKLVFKKYQKEDSSKWSLCVYMNRDMIIYVNSHRFSTSNAQVQC